MRLLTRSDIPGLKIIYKNFKLIEINNIKFIVYKVGNNFGCWQFHNERDVMEFNNLHAEEK